MPQQYEGIPIFLSNADQNDSSFNDYLRNYDELSKADLEQEIVDRRYLANQAAKLTSYLEGSPRSILEVGVGQGFLIRKLREKYPATKITAVDISIPFLKYVKSTVDVECMVANAENLPFMEEFDLVVASDILEHVINPIDFLISVNFSLNQDGLLALRVPFEDNMLQYSRLLGAKYKFAHLRNFSKRNLVLILNQAGFRVQRIHFDGFSFNRRRVFFREGGALAKLIYSRYPNENDVSNIHNWIGRALMRPLEIVVIAKKTRNVTSMNEVA
jgi:SAM-dependent methyltransferase